MQKRRLGTSSLEVSAIGLGCMSMTGGYSDKPDRPEMISLIRTAVDRGVTFFDTAEIYGPYANEALVGEALTPYKGRVVIATKFGWDIDPVERKPRGRVTSRPEVIKHVVDGSLHRLGDRTLCVDYPCGDTRGAVPEPRHGHAAAVGDHRLSHTPGHRHTQSTCQGPTQSPT